MNKEREKYEEETLWDIPAHLKEYHEIEYDHEENLYRIYGHKYEEVRFRPYYIGNIEMSDLQIKTGHKDHSIVDLDLKRHGVSITLYPLSTTICLYEPRIEL